jgi:DNA-binding XRE family transcriptional regulator
MKLFGDTQKSLADALGISLTSLNAKINETDGAEFRQHEITAIKIRYNLTAEEVDQIFFTQKVS